MKSKLYNAIQSNDARTENGAITHSTSGSAVLDMFFKMGGMRGQDESAIIDLFANAYFEDRILAIKAMFYNRDVRGGQGERRSFQIMFKWLCENAPRNAKLVFDLIPEYGRWDDLFVALDTDLYSNIVVFLHQNLLKGNVLLKKWMPRENKSKRDLAVSLMEAFNMTAKQYRQAIALHGEVVENEMCANEWSEINYNHVPSIASKKYRSAFGKHDADRYGNWLSALESGSPEAKINAGAIFPHDITAPYLDNKYGSRVDRTLEAQWKALPDYVQEGVNFIAVVDTSASMHMESAQNGLAGKVAFALGIYLAERNKSVFKDAVITFSRIAQLIPLTGTLQNKVRTLLGKSIVEDTNLESVFNLILDKAVAGRVAQEDMPNNILILSDMQFNVGTESMSDSAMSMIKRKYAKAGYEMPHLIYWNLRSSNGVPVKFDEQGTCLVSGFSPSIMQSLLGGAMTPMNMMLKVLDSERYAVIEERLS
jgi:hypothetical protein